MKKTKTLFVIASLSAMLFMIMAYQQDIGRTQAKVKTWGQGSAVACSEADR